MMIQKAVASSRRGVIKNGLVWHIDPTNTASYPGTGTTIYDLIGSYNGTFNGNITVNADKHMVLDGVNDWVAMGTVSSGDDLSFSTNDFTIGVWWRYSFGGDDYPNVIQAWTSTLSSGNGLAIFIERTTGVIGFGIKNASTYVQIVSSLSDLTVANTWEYWTVKFERSTSTGYIFKNGVECAYYSRPTMVNPTNSNKLLRVGATNYNTFGDFPGRIGAIHVYNRALSTAEIAQNYKVTKNDY
jgi:hypothetical protein